MKKFTTIVILIITITFSGCSGRVEIIEDKNGEVLSKTVVCTDYLLFETEDAVFFTDSNLPLLKYDKTNGDTYEISDIAYRNLIVEKNYVFGLVRTNSEDKIFRYDLLENKGEVLAEGVIVELAVQDNKVYYGEWSQGEKPSIIDYKKYEMNLDGTEKKQIQCNFEKSDDCSNSEDYGLYDIVYEKDVANDKYVSIDYLKTPRNIVYLGKYIKNK